MTEHIPPPATDEPRGDMADQASRLQMEEEQAAIDAALAGDVHGTDAIEDRSPVIDVLEGPDASDGESVDASDDPVYGGGMPVTDPGEADLESAGELIEGDLSMTGVAEDGTAMAVDEGGTVADSSAPAFESDGDPDFIAGDDLEPLDDESAAEDLDALIDVDDLGHDLDDPQNPDGYGVPPAPDGGSAVLDQADLRDPVDDAGPVDAG